MAASASPRRTFGFVSGVTGGTRFAGGSLSSSRGFTSATVSNPTSSISTLIGFSPRICPLHLANRARKIGTRLVKAVQRCNLIIVRARQRVLRGNHFNVVGHPGLETVARLIDFFSGQLHSQIRDLHFVASRFQVEQRGLYAQANLVAQILFLLFNPLHLLVRSRNLGPDPSTG